MKAYATLLTRPSYLVGVRTLNASLQLTGSAHPLLVMVTADVGAAERGVLAHEGCLVREVAAVRPGTRWGADYASARFAEVWTKLAAWGLTDVERLVVLDADMLVVASMDELFEVSLPDGGIAACHACRCNPERVPGYPASWNPDACSYTHCRGRDHTEEPGVGNYLNGGLLVLEPDQGVHQDLMGRLAGLRDLSRYPFAEQDFLNEHYDGRWRPLPYVFNALKTLPFQHPSLWDASEVKNIHYILDKPWETGPDPRDRYDPLHQLWRDVAVSLDAASLDAVSPAAAGRGSAAG